MTSKRKSIWGRRLLATLAVCSFIQQPLLAQDTSDSTAHITAVDEKDFDAAFYGVKRNNRLQFEIADPPEVIEPQLRENRQRQTRRRSSGDGIGIFTGLGQLFKVIFFAGLILIVFGILYFVLRDVRFAKREKQEKEKNDTPEVPLYAPDVEQARVLLDDVDKLAADGRFDEAVHTLLFRSIQDIDLKRPNVIRRSLTSREIGALKILTPATREAFASIAAVVELSFFGGRPIGEDEFLICRKAYEQFVSKESWEKAA